MEGLKVRIQISESVSNGNVWRSLIGQSGYMCNFLQMADTNHEKYFAGNVFNLVVQQIF